MDQKTFKWHVTLCLSLLLLVCIVGMVVIDCSGLPPSQSLTATTATLAGAVSLLAGDLANGKRQEKPGP